MMKFFPDSVRDAMRAGGAHVTVVPVQFDHQAWEAAAFFQLAGPQCKTDRHVLAKTDRPFPVTLETDLLERPQAAIVILRLEVFTHPKNPLVGEILLTPGASSTHHEALKLLSGQPRLRWFFSDEDFRVLYSQEHPLSHDQHMSFDELMRDALRHDALIRCTGRYDAQAALSEVIVLYEPRTQPASTTVDVDSDRG